MRKHRKWLSCLVLAAFLLVNVCTPALAGEISEPVTLPSNAEASWGSTTGQTINFLPEVELSEAGSRSGEFYVSRWGDTLNWSLNDGLLKVRCESGNDVGEMTTAFQSSLCEEVENIIVQDGVANIIDNAFSQCVNLQSVYLADSVVEIGNAPFANCENLVILGEAGSAAESYAKEMDLPFYVAAVGEKNTTLYITQPVNTVTANEISTSAVTMRNADGTVGDEVTWGVHDESILQILSSSFDATTGCSTVQLQGLQAGETTVTATAADGTTISETVYVQRGVDGDEVKTGALGDNITWTLVDGVLTVSGTGAITKSLDYSARWLVQEIVVEEGITALGEYCFEGCSALTKITLPSSMTTIALGAFSSCRALTEFQVPDTITSIEEYAFIGCTSLERIFIPNTVTSIAPWVFNGCSRLAFYGVAGSYAETYALAHDIPFSTQKQGIDGSFIYLEQSEKVLAVGSMMCLTATGNTAAIDWAVNDNTVLEIMNVSGDDSVVQLRGLKAGEVTVTATANGASTSRTIRVLDTFGTCGNNLTWNFSDGVLTISGTGEIEKDAWYFLAEQIHTVIVEEGVTSICACAFAGCESLTAVTLPSTLVKIGEVAFEECPALQDITIPVGVTEIGLGAFRGCSSLTEVVVPEGVTEIEMQTFAECTALTSVVLPKSLQSIGDYAFGNCPSLVEINLPSALTTLGNNVFVANASLQTIVLPDSLLSMGSGVFSNCQNLREVTFPTGLKTIPQDMFMSCSSLQNVVLPHALEIIESDAFSGCESFTSLTIPSNVTSIGNRAFFGCANITEIYFLGDAPQTGNLGFLDGSLSGVTAYYPADNATWAALSGMDRASYGGFYIEWVALGELGQAICVELDKTSANMLIGETLQLHATVKPDTATNKTLTWTSDNETVVTVDDNGVLTALQTGSAIITVTTNDGGYTATCTVSVTENGAIESGYCNFYGSNSGRNIYWTYEPDTGVLTLQGQGAIIDFYVESAYAVPAAFHKATTVVFEEGITRIGQQVFYNCDNIETLIIADSVTEIGEGAFTNCTGLRHVQTGDGITNLDAFTFGAALEHIEIGTGITEIPNGQFQNCVNLTEIEIPKQITRIGNLAFAGCTSLQEMVIPNQVTFIGVEAFSGCTLIDTITIPDSVIELGEGAFSQCTGLTKITLPNNIARIGDATFAHCTSLTGVIIPSQVTAIGTEAFSGCKLIDAITIPDSVTEIGASAFEGCSAVQAITIPDNVTTLGERVFAECLALSTVVIGSGVDTVPAGAFCGCSGLANITLGNNIKNIGGTELDFHLDGIGGAFENCSSLAQITLPKQLQTVATDAFRNCTSLKEIVLPDTVTSLGWYAFENCSALEKLVLSDGLDRISDLTFSGCNNLKYVDTGNGLTSLDGFRSEMLTNIEVMIIGDGISDLRRVDLINTASEDQIFKGNTSLEKVVIGRGITNINKESFYGCTSLSEMSIGENVTEIGAKAFENCVSLKEVAIPDSVTRIGVEAFWGCNSLQNIDTGNGISNFDGFELANSTSLQSITIGNKIKRIPNSTFINCKALENVKLATTTVSIGDHAFENCIALTNIIIPTGLTTIGSNAFTNCEALEYITLPNTLKTLGNSVFENCKGLSEIAIPNSVTEMGHSNFRDCSNLSIIAFNADLSTIPQLTCYGCTSLEAVNFQEGLSSIGKSAFSGCVSLKTVTIPDGCDIDAYAFEDCTALEKLGLKVFGEIGPGKNYAVGYAAFQNCSSLKEVVIQGEGALWYTKISDSAFENCLSLKKVILAIDRDIELGEAVFKGCTSLEEIYFENSGSAQETYKTIYIGPEAFGGCTALNKVQFVENSKVDIGTSAFDSCESLKKIDIHQDCNIGELAFHGCKSLKEIDLHQNSNIGKSAFNSCSALTSVVLMNTTVDDYAFADCTTLDNILISGGTFGGNVFDGCSSLSNVYFVNTVKIDDFVDNTFNGCGTLTFFCNEWSDKKKTSKTDIAAYAERKGFHVVDIGSQTGFSVIDCAQNDMKTFEDSIYVSVESVLPDWNISNKKIARIVDTYLEYDLYDDLRRNVSKCEIQGLCTGTTIIEYGYGDCMILVVKNGKSNITNDITTGSNGVIINIYQDEEQLTCAVGGTLDITATALYPPNLEDRGDITWTIGDTSILERVNVTSDVAVTGSSTLQVRGLKAGETTVTATTSDGASVTKTVKVTAGSAGLDIEGSNGTRIMLGQDAYTCEIGEVLELGATIIYDAEAPETETVLWSVEDKSIVEILDAPPDGKEASATAVWVKGLKEGMTTITACTSDGARSTRNIAVIDNEKIRILRVHTASDNKYQAGKAHCGGFWADVNKKIEIGSGWVYLKDVKTDEVLGKFLIEDTEYSIEYEENSKHYCLSLSFDVPDFLNRNCYIEFAEGSLIEFDGGKSNLVSTKNIWSFKTYPLKWWKFDNEGDNISSVLWYRMFLEVAPLIRLKHGNNDKGLCFGYVYSAMDSSFGNLDYKYLAIENRNETSNIQIANTGMSLWEYIQFAHIYQFTPEMAIEKNNTENQYDLLCTAVKDFKKGIGKPVIIGLRGTYTITEEGKTISGDFCHAVGVVDCQEYSDKLRIIVYDPNNPDLESKYIDVLYGESRYESNITSGFEGETIEFYLYDGEVLKIAQESKQLQYYLLNMPYSFNVKFRDNQMLTVQGKNILGNNSKKIVSLSSNMEINNVNDPKIIDEGNLYWISKDTQSITNTSGTGSISFVNEGVYYENTLPENASIVLTGTGYDDGFTVDTTNCEDKTVTLKYTSVDNLIDETTPTRTVELVLENAEQVVCIPGENGVQLEGVADAQITVTNGEQVIRKQIDNLSQYDSLEIGVDPSLAEVTGNLPDGGQENILQGEETAISGTITSYGDANAETTIRLLQDGAEVYKTTGTGNSTSYEFPNVAAGTYEMEVSKQGHATYKETITVGNEGITKDITIYLLGDVSKDGKLTVKDINLIRLHVLGRTLLSGYDFTIADVAKDDNLTVKDINYVRLAILGRKSLE